MSVYLVDRTPEDDTNVDPREMCCSSGRLDSMKALHYYQTSLPKLKVGAILNSHGATLTVPG